MVKEELPVDKGWAWAICGGVFIITFLLSATGQMISATLLDLVIKYDTTITTVSLMFLFQIASTSVCSIIATNFLVPRFGIRHVCVVSAAVSVVASMIFTVSPSIYMCIALFGIKGACNGLMAIPAISILGFYFRKHRSIATSLAMCGICGGSIAYPPFVRFLLSVYGLQGTYLICSAIEAHIIVACMLIRPVTMYRFPPPPPPPSEKLPEDGAEEDEMIHYKANPAGSMECLDNGVDDYNDEKDPNSSLVGKSTNGHEQKHSLYENKNGTTAGTVKPRTVSFTSDEGAENSPKQSLLISETKDGVANGQEFSSKERIEKRKELYRKNRSVSVNSDDPLQYKRRMLRDGQRPSLWSLASNPSTLGIPQEPELLESDELEKPQPAQGKSAVWRKINQIFDLTLFRNWTFVWMLIAAVPCGTNQLVFVFLPTVGYYQGANKDQSALLLTIMGSVDLISRLAIGILADKKFVRISTIIGIASICLGIVAMFIKLYVDMPTLIVMAVFLGMFVGIRMSLGTVMFIEIVGLEKMAKSFSIYAMFLTMSGAIHSPLLGQMMESLGAPPMMYYLAFTFIFGGVMVLSLPLVQRVESRYKKNRDSSNTADSKKLQP